MIVSASLAVSGLATIPIRLLTDRVRRVPILVVSVLLWSAALVATGASNPSARQTSRRLTNAVSAQPRPG